jgi:hypothetical protein
MGTEKDEARWFNVRQRTEQSLAQGDHLAWTLSGERGLF